MVDPDYPQVRLYRRDIDRGWTSDRPAGLDAVVDMPFLDMPLSLADLYSGLVLRPPPALVDPSDNSTSISSI